MFINKGKVSELLESSKDMLDNPLNIFDKIAEILGEDLVENDVDREILSVYLCLLGRYEYEKEISFMEVLNEKIKELLVNKYKNKYKAIKNTEVRISLEACYSFGIIRDYMIKIFIPTDCSNFHLLTLYLKDKRYLTNIYNHIEALESIKKLARKKLELDKVDYLNEEIKYKKSFTSYIERIIKDLEEQGYKLSCI